MAVARFKRNGLGEVGHNPFSIYLSKHSLANVRLALAYRLFDRIQARS